MLPIPAICYFDLLLESILEPFSEFLLDLLLQTLLLLFLFLLLFFLLFVPIEVLVELSDDPAVGAVEHEVPGLEPDSVEQTAGQLQV